MSSLRLALKQSLQESGGGLARNEEGPRPKPKEKKAPTVPPSDSDPTAPPRKRGRPRKHPLPVVPHTLMSQEHSTNDQGENITSDEATARMGLAAGSPDQEDGYSSEENEFSDVDKDPAFEEEPGLQLQRDTAASPHEPHVADSIVTTKPQEPSLAVEDEAVSSTETELKQREDFENNQREENHRTSAANKIRNQWKQKQRVDKIPTQDNHSDKPSDDHASRPDATETGTARTGASLPSVPLSPADEPKVDTSSLQGSASVDPSLSNGTGKSRKKDDETEFGPKANKTVQAPLPEVLEWVRNLPVKRARKWVTSGLRVKVRFATKVKRDGKMFRKKRWYGGRVSNVSNLGTKIRIQYDDGTTEVTRFPDDDVVVDETLNALHDEVAREAAVKFTPPMSADTVISGEGGAKIPFENTNTGNGTATQQREDTLRSVSADNSTESEEGRLKNTVQASGETKTFDRLVATVKVGAEPALPNADAVSQTTVNKPDQPRRKRGRPPKNRRPEELAVSGGKEEGQRKIAKSLRGDQVSNESKKQQGIGRQQGESEDTHAATHSKTNLGIRVSQTKIDGATKSPCPGVAVNGERHSDRENSRRLQAVEEERDVSSKRLHIHIGGGSSSDAVVTGSNLQKTKGARVLGKRDVDADGSPASISKSPRQRKPKRKRFDVDVDSAAGLPSIPDLEHGSSISTNVSEGGAGLVASKNSAFDRQIAFPMHPSGSETSFGEDGKPLTPRGRSKQDAGGVRPGRRAAQQANEKLKNKGKKRDKRRDGEGDESESSEDDSQKWVQCDACRKWRIIPSSVVSTLPNQWYCSDNIHDPKRASCDIPEQTQKDFVKEKKRLKKRQQRLMMEAAAAADGQVGDLQKKEGVERAKSPKPEVDVRPKRPLSDSGLDNGSDTLKKSDKAKKGKQEELPELAPPAEPVVKVRRGRGRPPRNVPKESESSTTPQAPSDEAENLEWVQCEKCDKWRKLPPHVSADELPEVWYCSMNTWNPASANCNAPEDKADGLQDTGVFGNSGVIGNGKLSYRSLIFGNTGRKANRPVSERTRAAESLFADPADEDDPHPTVMYANSSAFVCRSKSNQPTNENAGITMFELMNGSHLWSNFNGSPRPMNTCSDLDSLVAWSMQRTNHFTYDALPVDVRQPMKDMVVHFLGTKTLSGEDLHAEIQSIKLAEFPTGFEKARAFCTVDVIVTTLCELVKEGRVECVQKMSTTWAMSDWNPRYRVAVPRSTSSTAESSELSAEVRKESRCMKISKPWKKRARIQ